jgi:ADP-heptose:LPS heptosyltransferase
LLKSLLNTILKKVYAVELNESKDLGDPASILIIRQHNQLGDLLATVSFFRALKEKFPQVKITLIASPDNYTAMIKNKYIDKCFIFNKKKLFSFMYFFKLYKTLKSGYDLTIVPVTVSISFTSNFLARLSKSKSRIGIKELNGMKNKYDFFFDRNVVMDWRKHPDENVSEFCLEMLRPYGITTTNFKSEITFDEDDISAAVNFAEEIGLKKSELLIGLHIGAGKPPNRWALDNFAQLIENLDLNYSARFYFTGTDSDIDEINYLLNKLNVPFGLFLNKQITEVAALVSISSLFITNDTGIMHVAGATVTPQISIFGPTNPHNWAPLGRNKFFIRKSELINDVSAEDVLILCKGILTGGNVVHINKKENLNEKIYAVADCGSNSFHLLVAVINENEEFKVLSHKRDVLRIGANKESGNIISPAGTEKAILTLKKYKLIAQTFNVSVRAVGTSAIRNAANKDEFLKKIKSETGIDIEVLDGNEEARLIFLGIQKAIQVKNQKVLCIDIGGGSTEFIVGLNGKILFASSIDLGAVRLKEMFFPDGHLSNSRIERCSNYINELLQAVVRDIPKIGFDICAGASGTIMSSAFMIRAMQGKPPSESYTINNFTFTKEEFYRVEQLVIGSTSPEEREKIPGIDKGREDIIPAGILILSSIIKILSINEITVSAYAIREGVIIDSIEKSIN